MTDSPEKLGKDEFTDRVKECKDNPEKCAMELATNDCKHHFPSLDTDDKKIDCTVAVSESFTHAMMNKK